MSDTRAKQGDGRNNQWVHGKWNQILPRYATQSVFDKVMLCTNTEEEKHIFNYNCKKRVLNFIKFFGRGAPRPPLDPPLNSIDPSSLSQLVPGLHVHLR